MGEDQDRSQEPVLPQADGPLVTVELPDHQVLFAVVKARRQEADTSWWFDLQIHLPSQGSKHGRLLAVPAAVDFRAPAGACQPIEGQSYGRGAHRAVRRPGPVADRGTRLLRHQCRPARIVHRGDCRAVRDVSRPATTEQARTILTRPEAAGEEFEDGWDEDDERLGSPNDAGGAPAGDEQPSGPDAVPRPSPITTP
ncbi:DUF6233 domain-containing protein [Streptomyces sp. IBSBF 2435]|uniref:DUF6233 domain-containing protein n=1 Tax=Streptomyces sp. IBSBF 2435 TaxID=2903531 RepID=UPI002FDBFC89